MHIHNETRRCYIGITQMRARQRWRPNAYRLQRVFGAAVSSLGWGSFESHILAFCHDRNKLLEAEVVAIRAAGGHLSRFTFNGSPGGEIVAENDKPLVGVHLDTGTEVAFKGGSQATRALGLRVPDGPMAVARGERTSVAGWWFRFADKPSQPPSAWGEELRVQRIRELQGKKIVAIHTVTNEVRYFSTTSEAADNLGVEQSAVSMVARGEGHSAHGWWFKFSDDSRAMPSSFGTDATRKKRDRILYALNLYTGERRSFRNCSVADKELNLHMGAAASVASGSRASAGDWWFSYTAGAQAPNLFKGALVAKSRSKPIVATCLATGERSEFPNGKMASMALGVHRSAISQILQGKRSSSCGFTFSEKVS